MNREALLRPFLATATPADLGPGPRAEAQSFAALSAALDATLPQADLSKTRAELVRALLLLWHDHLEEAHQLAQAIENRDGSYVHGLMHRREPDYGNAKYWFRRVGAHPCFGRLADATAPLLKAAGQPALAGVLLPGGPWDAFAFVDACERLAGRDSRDAEVRALQQLQETEFEVLLDYLLV